MEPIVAEIAPKTRYVIETTVLGVLEHTRRVWKGFAGREAQFDYESLGWFVHFNGSHEMLGLGPDKPDVAMGDKVRITIERIG